MADVRIELEAVSKDLIKSLDGAAKSAESLLKGLRSLTGSHEQAQKGAEKQTDSETKLTEAQKKGASQTAITEKGLEKIGKTAGRVAAFYLFLYEAAKKAFSIFGDTLKFAIRNIDEFNRATIGTAAAITNIADQSLNAGRTYESIFLQNLKATRGTFIELERLAAKYFASSIDLQLAYNTFAQRGVVIRRAELTQLAQLTDLILLLTQGQQSTIQVQEEIRSLMTGTLRPTAQLGQLLKAFGLNVKEVGQQIRATQSLKPLEGILVGARAATNEIQKTYQAALNGLETIVRQVSRIAGEGFFNTLVGSIRRFTAFIDANKTKLSAVAAVLGEVIGDVVDRFRTAIEAFLSGQGIEQSIGPFIRLAAVIQAVGSALFRILEITLVILRNLPAAIAAFQDTFETFDLDPAKRKLKEGEKEIKQAIDDLVKLAQNPETSDAVRALAEKQITELHNQLSIIEKQLDEKPPFQGILDSAKKFLGEAIPGFKQVVGGSEALSKALDALLVDVDKLAKFDFTAEVNDNIKTMTAAAKRVQTTIKELTEVSQDTFAAPRLPFAPSPEQLAEQSKLTKQLAEAEIALARARRTRRQQETAQEIDQSLNALRRQFTLIQQGFQLGAGGGIERLRSVAATTSQFIRENLHDLSVGAVQDFSVLELRVSDVIEQTTFSVFNNLRKQLETTKEGLEKFQETSKAALAEVIAAEAQPHFDASRKILSDAQTVFDATIKQLNLDITTAQAKIEAAKKANDPKAEAEGLKELADAQQNILTGTKTAQEALNFAKVNADLENQIGIQKRLKAEEQSGIALQAEKNRLKQNELRITQQIEQEVGRLGQANVQLAQAITSQAQGAAAGQPRTELDAARAEVNNVSLQISTNIGIVLGQLTSLTVILEDLAAQGNQAAIANLAFVEEQKGALIVLQAQADAARDAALANANYAVTLNAVKNATESTLNGIADALLDSFEGKKTDFTRVFKDIADSLFKDSLKNTFQEASKALQKGVKSVFESLTGDVTGEMASTLGPAFTAGFGLIASFVLGQLLQGNNSSSNPANPNVGITSSEQVRGLIGGETQIPIGLVGESLQDALVPTNLLLARIARGVESIRASSGLSADAIESAISTAVSESLQIQTASV